MGSSRCHHPTAGWFFSGHSRDGWRFACTNLDRLWLAAVLWFGMLIIGGVQKKIIALTFIAGLAYVLTFMDGVAPISKYISSSDNLFWNGMYVMTQQVSWWGAAAWAIFIFAVLAKNWSSRLASCRQHVDAGRLSTGVHNAFFEVQRFSMFLPAPLINTALVVLSASPRHTQNDRYVDRRLIFEKKHG